MRTYLPWVITALLTVLTANAAQAASAPVEEQAGTTVATVIVEAPIFVKVGFTTPLRVAAVGTRLNVLGSQGDWTQVQFNDPQFGLRTGFVETKQLRLERPHLVPMDLSVPASARPEPEDAQPQATARTSEAVSRGREGFFFNIGLGFGSLGCEDCDGRSNGVSGGVSLGGAISDRVLLGVGTTGFAKEVAGELFTVGTLDGRVRVYPSRTSGFFLNAGVGLGSIDFAGESEFGLGVMLGLGWDIRVGRRVSLTPFWNGSAMRNDTVDANFGQLGLGVTIH